MDEWNLLAQKFAQQQQLEEQERQRQQLAQQYTNAQNNYANAQNKKTGWLESVLSGIVNSVGNVGKSLYDLGGSTIAGWRDVLEGKNADKEGSYTQEFKKSIYGGDNAKDRYAKSAGTSLDAAVTLSDFIPVAGGASKVGKLIGGGAAQIGQGALSGVAQNYIDNGANVSAEDNLKSALVGGAGAGVGRYVGGKLAGRVAGPGKISKAINSNLGRAAITGAAAGAAGGGLSATLNGGDLAQVLSAAAEGAGRGATGGATMAGIMGLTGRGIDALNRKYGGDVQTPETVAETPSTTRRIPVQEAQPVEDVAQTATRRSIPVTDYDAGEQSVRVRRPDTEYSLGRRQGSNIDGILSPDNARQLPNAQKRTFTDLFGDENIKTAADAISANELDDPMAYLRDTDNNIPKELVTDVQNAARDYHDSQQLSGAGYVKNKSELPKIKRSEYEFYTGLKGKDIPDYMRPYLSEKNGLSLSDGAAWGDILTNAKGEGSFGGSADDILELYERASNTNARDIYTPENIEAGLRLDPELNNRLSNAMVEDTFPTRKIDVKAAPSIADNIDVEDTSAAPNITKRTLPGRQAQAAPTAAQEAPTTASPIRRSTDLSMKRIDPNLSQSEVATLEREITVNRQKQGAALLDQYGTLDAPLRRSLGSPEEVLTTLYDDYGLTTPADVQYAANHVTGKDGVVSQWTRELAKKADRVETAIDTKWLEDMMDLNGLTDEEAKVVTKQIKASLKRTGSDGYSDGNTALDVIKQLEKQSAQYKGKDGTTYRRGSQEDTRKALVLDSVRDELQNRVWDAAGDAQQVLTPARLTQLKNMYPGNEKWADFVDNKLGKVRNGADMRSTMKPLVDGAKIVNGSKQSAGSYADRAIKGATSANPKVALLQTGVDAVLNSDPAKQRRADNYARKAATAEAKLTGQEVPKAQTKTTGKAPGIVSEITSGVKNAAKKVGGKISNAATALNNDTFSGKEIGSGMTIGDLAARQIARQPALTGLSNERADQESQRALQDMQNIQNEYNDVTAQQQQTMNYAPQYTNQGTSQLDTISRAMQLALNAGDFNSYSQLADLYKQAYNIYSLQNPTATSSSASSEKALNATQAKAVTGLQQLQQLSSMQPTAKTALANSPLGGLVDLTGGDEYNSQADSLATTLGYLLSGANIKDNEIAAIKRDYVPSTFDSQAVRQQKLSRAEQLLRSYLSDTGALTSL